MSSDKNSHFLSLIQDGTKEDGQKYVEKVPALCPNVALGCGGCLLQEYSYKHQLEAKAKLLDLVYAHEVKVHAAKNPFYYRSRMDYVYSFEKIGLRKSGKYTQVVDITQCSLLPEHTQKVYLIAHDLLKNSGLESYNYLCHKGFVSYLVVRSSIATKEVMINIITKEPRDDSEEQILKSLLEKIYTESGATSVWWSINYTMSDLSTGDPHMHFGKDHILDNIAGIVCKIKPQTFFQGNVETAGVLFSDAMKHVHGNVLDLCCGVGVLSMLAARRQDVHSVVGVDINEYSIECAKENIALNNFSVGTNRASCEFICQDMFEYLESIKDSPGEHNKFDTIICDPARAGLDKNVCKLLNALTPKKIVYISCNPHSHKEDMDILKRRYDCTLLEAYDLFPQTPHVEILSVFTRKD